VAYRRGIVKEVDGPKHRAKVAFPDKGGVLSPWLDVLVPSTRGDKDVRMPALEMQVACVLDEKDEAGAIVGALFSDADPSPNPSLDVRSVTFGDGGLLEYNRATHVLTVTLPESGEVHLSAPGGKVVVEVGAGVIELAGNTHRVALAELVRAELDAIAGAFGSHTHPAGALVAPGGGGPVTGASGPSAGYTPGDIHTDKVKAAP